MLHANFNTYNNYVTDSLYQWDKNQDLIIEGLNLSVAPEVHFSNARMDKAIVKQSTLNRGVITVRIPNSLLQESLIIKAYIGIYKDDAFNIIESVEIPIIARERPSDYSFTTDEEEIYSFNALEYKVGAVLDLVKTSVSPIWETLYDNPEGLTPGYPIPINADRYASYIATVKSAVATVDIPLYRHEVANIVCLIGKREVLLIDSDMGETKISIECNIDNNNLYLDKCTTELFDVVERIPLVKLVGVTKEPAEYINIKHTYDPESEDAISGKGVAQALSQFEIPEIPENNNTGSGVSEAQRQTLLAVINAIGLFNVDNAQVLLDNFNKAWDIVEPVPATSIALNKIELTFTSEDTQTITATVLPVDTTDVVTWKSSNTSVATVKNGVITPLVDGETIITATAGNVSATCAVIVNMYGEIENPVFLTAGVLNTSSTATSDPKPSETYNRSSSFNAVPVKKNDILTCKSDCLSPKDWYKFFIYDTDGANCTALWSTAAQGWDTVTATKDGFIRLSILGHATGNNGLTNVITEYSVTSNGVKTTYTVVDKR